MIRNGERVEHLSAYRKWIVDGALPVWSTRGFDAAAGRFRERLDWSGAPIDVPHRAMVQARQIYVYSHAYQLGWFPGGRDLAERAMASLLRDYGDVSEREASFAFSIDGRGGIASSARDAYTHAFMLFAMAWLHRVNGDPALLTLADRTDAFVQNHLFDTEHGGMFETHPATVRTKRQNPLMHLLEAYLALERAAPGRGHLDRASRIVQLFEARLLDARHGVLLEHFAEDWSAHPDAAMADVFEPGHHFEWVWLLREYEQLGGTALRGQSDTLYRAARERGVDADGRIHDELGSDGSVRKASHRVWPHTEAIKAATARHAGGDASALGFADSMAHTLLQRFLDRPFAGGWIDHVSATGTPLVDYVPASTLYHLFFAASESAHVDCADDASTTHASQSPTLR
jgi:mannose/cellobiose epimerase-like protein (N-acyl-D-glucosamine 2-epimerase family)